MTGVPRVSVVIPAHDAAATIVEAIDSALGQTVAPFEVIVVDDASSDGTREAVAEMAARHATVRLHVLAENGGVSHARNVGAALAGGDWIALLDADDVWLPEKTAKQLALAASRPDLAIIGAHFQEQFGERRGATRAEFWWPSALLVRADVFDVVRFDPRWRLSELPEFFSRFDEHFTRGGVPESLMRYRMNTTGIAHRSFVTERMAWLLIGENRRRRATAIEEIDFRMLHDWYRTAHPMRRRWARSVGWRGDRLLRRALIEASQRRFGHAVLYGTSGVLLNPRSVLQHRSRFRSARAASRLR